ncbi:MAG: hypothetical protein QW500_04295 [Candidatus Micrarchaeia archaeon]
MSNGLTSVLTEDAQSGELVCKYDSQHRFTVGRDGFLKVVNK